MARRTARSITTTIGGMALGRCAYARGPPTPWCPPACALARAPRGEHMPGSWGVSSPCGGGMGHGPLSSSVGTAIVPPQRWARGWPLDAGSMWSSAGRARPACSVRRRPSGRRCAGSPRRGPPTPRPLARALPPAAVCLRRAPRRPLPGPSPGGGWAQPQGGPLATRPAVSSPPSRRRRRSEGMQHATAHGGMAQTLSRRSSGLSPVTAPRRRPAWRTPGASSGRAPPLSSTMPAAPTRWRTPHGPPRTPPRCSSRAAQWRRRSNRTRTGGSSPCRRRVQSPRSWPVSPLCSPPSPRGTPPEAPSVPGSERRLPVPWPFVLDASPFAQGSGDGKVHAPAGARGVHCQAPRPAALQSRAP
jgi:hypothetical protein